MDKHMASAEIRACIDNCTECHRICVETSAYCLQSGGQHAGATHLGLLLDCAEICATSADFMSRGSELHSLTCGVCADVCARSARSCQAFGTAGQMKRDAQAS